MTRGMIITKNKDKNDIDPLKMFVFVKKLRFRYCCNVCGKNLFKGVFKPFTDTALCFFCFLNYIKNIFRSRKNNKEALINLFNVIIAVMGEIKNGRKKNL